MKYIFLTVSSKEYVVNWVTEHENIVFPLWIIFSVVIISLWIYCKRHNK